MGTLSQVCVAVPLGKGACPASGPPCYRRASQGKKQPTMLEKRFGGAAHHNSHPRGDTLVMHYGPVWCVLCAWCSAEPSEGGICFRVIHSWQGLHCDAAGLFQFCVSMKIQPSYTVAKKMWGTHLVSTLEEL